MRLERTGLYGPELKKKKKDRERELNFLKRILIKVHKNPNG